MKIKWYGHAAFRITTDQGVRIIMDPYQSGAFGGALSYGKITDEADVVITSHDHDDHNYIKDIKGTFLRIDKAGAQEVKGVRIKGISTYHDGSKGADRGNNLLFVIEAEGVRVGHMGDLGHVLGKETLASLGRIDVLLIPVGGFYTIDAKEATAVMESIGPSLTIPMHYLTPKCEFPIAPVADFTKGKKGVREAGTAEIEVTKTGLPKETEIVVMSYAL